MNHQRFLPLLFLLPAVACGGRQPPLNYVRAEPVKDDPPKPLVVEIPKPTPVPGQLKRAAVPTSVSIHHGLTTARSRRPSDVVREANRKATEGPTAADYINAIVTYDYAPGTLYQIYTAPQHLTDVQLQPGEHLVGKPATGDTIRWVLARGASSSGGSEQQHIYIKPTRPDLETTLALNTDRRSYILELHSYDDTYMAGVAWRYPQDEAAQLENNLQQEQLQLATSTPTAVTVEKLNFNYGVRAVHGRPQWVPTQVFDDGHKTFIRFPEAMLDREAPALFVVSSTGDTQLVNYRVKADTYVVDRLFDSAELRLGQQDQEIVQVIRTR
ncbi:MAG TPA: P-type conjugative transfer protein TrbG [Polyangia bacterium]|nr:P-type conjugative transfer protein TrbG [Polyangia bacterium]